MKRLISALTLTLLCMAMPMAADAPKIVGKWQFVLDMSHGKKDWLPERSTGRREAQRHGRAREAWRIDNNWQYSRREDIHEDRAARRFVYWDR